MKQQRQLKHRGATNLEYAILLALITSFCIMPLAAASQSFYGTFKYTAWCFHGGGTETSPPGLE